MRAKPQKGLGFVERRHLAEGGCLKLLQREEVVGAAVWLELDVRRFRVFFSDLCLRLAHLLAYNTPPTDTQNARPIEKNDRESLSAFALRTLEKGTQVLF